MKALFSTLLALGAVSAGAWYFWLRPPAVAAPRYETAKVERGRITSRVTASGTLSALVTVQVGSQVSGRIQQIFVDFNSKVTKGQLIAQIDPQLYQAAHEQQRANRIAAEASVRKAQIQAEDAQRQFLRSKQLNAEHLVPDSELDTAEATARAADAQIAVAQGALAQAKAAEHQAEVNLGYTKIYSPIDGMVISRNVDPGQTVAASLQAPTLFTIAEDLTKMQVDTNVAESDVGKLKAGIAATFTVDAYPGEVFRGRVRQIRNSPLVVQNVVTYDAVIDVDNPDLKLRPGMTANVTVVHAEKDDALRVPTAALRFRPPRNEGEREAGGSGSRPQSGADPSLRTLHVLRDQRLVPVRVRTGLTDGTTTEIQGDALQEGDQVVVESVGGEGGGQGGGGRPGGFRRMF